MQRKTIILKPSHRCNLNCSYCYDRENREQDSSVLPVEKLIEALQKCYDEYKSLIVVWHGGEPTVLGIEYWRKVLEAFKGKDIEWNVQTNGVLINDEWGKLFSEYNCTVGTSWDGLPNKTRSKNSDAFFNFINTLKKYDLQYSSLFTITPDNYEDALSAAIFGIQTDTQIEFNLIFDYYREIEDNEYKAMACALLQVFDLYCTIDTIKWSRPFDNFIHYLRNEDPNVCERIICRGNWLSINPNGDIGICGKPWPKNMFYGNIFDENFSLKDIGNNQKIKDFFEKAEDIQWNTCRDCKWLLQCNNGCPYSCLNKKTGEIEWNKGWCVFNKTLFDGMLEIAKIRYKDGTLKNQQLNNLIEQSGKTEIVLWKNYKYPII